MLTEQWSTAVLDRDLSKNELSFWQKHNRSIKRGACFSSNNGKSMI
jgi:hypothetical protein